MMMTAFWLQGNSLKHQVENFTSSCSKMGTCASTPIKREFLAHAFGVLGRTEKVKRPTSLRCRTMEILLFMMCTGILHGHLGRTGRGPDAGSVASKMEIWSYMMQGIFPYGHQIPALESNKRYLLKK